MREPKTKRLEPYQEHLPLSSLEPATPLSLQKPPAIGLLFVRCLEPCIAWEVPLTYKQISSERRPVRPPKDKSGSNRRAQADFGAKPATVAGAPVGRTPKSASLGVRRESRVEAWGEDTPGPSPLKFLLQISATWVLPSTHFIAL